MGQLDDLKPVAKPRVYDLVREAGLDVSDWANFLRGSKWAAANPKYCYEWAFVEPRRVVILNLWYDSLDERQGTVTWSGNGRKWIQQYSASGVKSIWRRRAEAFERAVHDAHHGALPIRVIVNDGKRRKTADPTAKASTVQRRMLDPLPWAVTFYNERTGQCTLTRGAIAKGSADQFDLPDEDSKAPVRTFGQSSGFERDHRFRDAALQRANGRCEFCFCPGFTTSDGKVFLETHHVIPLSEGGPDSAGNVVAICPNHHREAHHGSRAAVIRETLLNRLARRKRG